jgi:hypothetical protein
MAVLLPEPRRLLDRPVPVAPAELAHQSNP